MQPSSAPPTPLDKASVTHEPIPTSSSPPPPLPQPGNNRDPASPTLRDSNSENVLTLTHRQALDLLAGNHSFSLSLNSRVQRDALSNTYNNRSFQIFLERKKYNDNPLIPPEVYENTIGPGERGVFVPEEKKANETVEDNAKEEKDADPERKDGLETQSRPRTPRAPDTTAEAEEEDMPVLIYPKKIDNLHRFRILFMGLCLFITSSLQGLHSILGLLLLDQYYKYSLTENINIYLCGQAFGMFVLPFGVLYDFFGPRPVVALGSATMMVAELLFALSFGGTLRPTPARMAVFYGLFGWGCYAVDVAVLPCVLTHMPRDRAQPVGLLKTFSGLGFSFVTCLYRGFFNRASHTIEENFSALFWFCFTLTGLVGIIGVFYLRDAPYVVTRAERIWDNRFIRKREKKGKDSRTPEEQADIDKEFEHVLQKYLKKFLIRNRYVTQLMPKRRYNLVTIVLILLNFYLTIQAICGAWFADSMTPGKFRGLAIGAICVVVLIFILVIPIRAIDEPSPQDTEVIQTAKEKEEGLLNAKEQRHREEYMAEKRRKREERIAAGEQSSMGDVEIISVLSSISSEEKQKPLNRKKIEQDKGASLSVKRRGQINLESTLVEMRFIEPASDHEPYPAEEEQIREETPVEKSSYKGTHSHPGSHEPFMDESKEETEENAVAQVGYTLKPAQNESEDGDREKENKEKDKEKERSLEVKGRPYSTYDHPFVDIINVCGEVFVAPIYQTNFFKSLSYVDIYLLFFTTFVTWGVGLSVTANYNIYIMLLARNKNMDYKMYILYSAFSAVSIAAGRVFIGVWERFTFILKKKKDIYITPTAVYPVCTIILFVGNILWIALPGRYILIMSYIIMSAGYGLATSLTPYVISTIYEKDVGTHYGFCFLGAAIGMVIFHRLVFYQLYLHEATEYPPQLFVGKRCIGERRCLNLTIGIYLIFLFVAIITSYLVHYRYKKLVLGKVDAPKRVFVPVFKKIFSCCFDKKTDHEEENENKKEKDTEKNEEQGNEALQESEAASSRNSETSDRSSEATEALSDVVVDAK